jgi:hypothetical protein
MNEERKKPGVAFWATVVVVVVLVAYPLSFGPACWLTSRTRVGVRLIPAVYRPLIWASLADGRGATPIGAVLVWYTELGRQRDGDGQSSTASTAIRSGWIAVPTSKRTETKLPPAV